MALDPIHAFYCTDAYLSLAQMCKVKSGGICARCGQIFEIAELRPHHIIELTLDNIDDVNITLNPDNIEVLCEDCHNAQHGRFGHTVGQKHIYLVYGSPFAGKQMYVSAVATRHDLIIDLDKIHRSLCICGLYDKPDSTKSVAFNVRDYLLNEARTAGRRRKWQDAYIIGTYPDRLDREEIVREYAAELVHVATPKEECIKRAYQDIQRPIIRDAAVGWINNYWQRYRA